MSQKLPVNDFKWIEDNSWFDESLIKGYNDGGCFLEVDRTHIIVYHFYLEEWILKK